jgi:NADPH2:quinone reductase
MFKASPDELRACSVDMNRWMSEGKLKAQIGKTLSLAEAAAAHRLQEENTLQKSGTLAGKIVLNP